MPRAPFRRVLAALLVTVGLAALATSAFRLDAPGGVSVSLARKFWRASPRARVLNSRLFQSDVELGAALVAADRAWPLVWDADLVLPEDLAEALAEEKRRKAAFVLAPRRVFVRRDSLAGERFSLVPRRPPR